MALEAARDSVSAGLALLTSMLEEELEELLLELELEDRVMWAGRNLFPLAVMQPCFWRAILVALLGSALTLCSSG